MPRDRVLVLCKTYPSPSRKYVETSCVAALRRSGGLVRLYPVPFRLISDDQQFKKWQWIEAEVRRSQDDRRPESHRIGIDTITCGDAISSADGWRRRSEAIASEPVFSDFDLVETERIRTGKTLTLLRPAKIIDLEITEVPCADWTDDEVRKLLQQQNQPGLFDDADKVALRTLRKLPYAFHYKYECDGPDGPKVYRHKIVDWEAGALFWNCKRRYGSAWQEPFRAKLLDDLRSKDLQFLMGTIHRFPDKWLIVSLIYPPRGIGPIQQSLL